jgi:phage head maturation protease
MNGIFFEFQKVDAEQRIVSGYASTEKVDMAGEIVSKSAIEAALTDYMSYANVREMHMNKAAGIVERAEVDEKGLYITAKVVDDSAWTKVKAGVYKGFSIGGRVLSKVGNTITKLLLTEISLVDRPCNPEAVFDIVKINPSHDSSYEEFMKHELSQYTDKEQKTTVTLDLKSGEVITISKNLDKETETKTPNEETQMENSVKAEDLAKSADTSKLDELNAKLEKALESTSKVLEQNESLVKQNEDLTKRVKELETLPQRADAAVNTTGVAITKAADSLGHAAISTQMNELEELIKAEEDPFEKAVIGMKQVHLTEPTPAILGRFGR